MRVKGQWYLNIHSIDSSRVGQRFLLAGRLLQLVVCCRGEWKVTVKDKDGPRDSCGRTVCRLTTSIVGWQLCVETQPQVVEQCFDWWKFPAMGVKLSRRESMQAARHLLYSVSRICMENRRVTIDELQLLTSLCSATCNNS